VVTAGMYCMSLYGVTDASFENRAQSTVSHWLLPGMIVPKMVVQGVSSDVMVDPQLCWLVRR